MDDIQIKALALQCAILERNNTQRNVASVRGSVIDYVDKYIDYIKTGDKSQFKQGM